MITITTNFKEDSITLEEVKVTYTQDTDCMQDNDDCQVLTLEAVDGGGGMFYRMTTNQKGWSFDKIDSLIEVLKNFKDKVNSGISGELPLKD